jgi:alanine racemase
MTSQLSPLSRRLHVRSSATSADRVEAGADEVATQRAWVEVNLAALRHNIDVLQTLLGPSSELWAVIKANAYGHGAIAVGREAIAAGVSGLCVATLAEGIELRQAGLSCPILVLGALRTAAELQAAAIAELDVTVTAVEQIPVCEAVAATLQHPLPVHLKVDTGMSRLGVPWTEALAVWQQLVSAPQLVERSLYSHFATADELHHPATIAQHQRFQQVVNSLQASGLPLPPLHMANSAATLANPQWHYQRVRVGLALYGLSPAPNLAASSRLQPILTVKARIVHLHDVPAETGVSYGHRYTTPAPTRLATVAIGYADGLPRRLSGCIRGYVRGQFIQQVGSVTMDQTIWDVGSIPDIAVGDVVDLFAGGLNVGQWAEVLDTIAYEILCGFSDRLPRRYLFGRI